MTTLFNKLLFIVFTLVLPVSVYGADEEYIDAKLINKSSGKEAYYLLQDKMYAQDPSCVEYPPELLGKPIAPGSEVAFKIKKKCVWIHIGFEAHRVSDNKLIAIVVYSRRDGRPELEIKDDCPNAVCTFYDLNPVQNRDTNKTDSPGEPK